MRFSNAVSCGHALINAHKPKCMCAYEKKIRMANSVSYQEATLIQYLSTMSNILTFSVSKNESLLAHNGLGCT